MHKSAALLRKKCTCGKGKKKTINKTVAKARNSSPVSFFVYCNLIVCTVQGATTVFAVIIAPQIIN